MTFNDSRWSAFWCRGSSVNAVPDSRLFVGKHTAQDPDSLRLNETVGYIVFESGTYLIDGITYTAGVGQDTIRGITDSPVSYLVIAGLAAMDGGDGGWAVLTNSAASINGQVELAVDEDIAGDSERAHTTEQLSYFTVQQ